MQIPRSKFPCPCCGYLVFVQPPGSHAVCPICCWEDDMAQLRFAEMPGSANTTSLRSAQQNYIQYGASSLRVRGMGRAPLDGDRREREWRCIDVASDNLEHPVRGQNYTDSYPVNDPTVLYYWRTNYWRRYVS